MSQNELPDPNETPIQKAVRLLGGPTAAAKQLNCGQSFVSQMASGDRPVPPKKARLIEMLTGVPKEETCPSAFGDLDGQPGQMAQA